MLCVLLAMLPGILATLDTWGLGILWNLAWLLLFCVVIEWLCLTISNRPLATHSLKDLSAVVTAVLIALCLPPYTSAYILLVASLAAIGLAKHAYGGLGRNVFNPAMVGFAIVLVSFPDALNIWPSLLGVTDGLTGATQLSEFRYREGMTTAEFDLRFARTIAAQDLIAALFIAGGLVLLSLKIITWHIPAGCLLGLALASLFGYDQGSSQSHGSVIFHLFSGGFAMAMFFVATDPVSHPRDKRHQVLYGIVIGLLTYLIRAFGVFPDGIAFAVLLANCMTPLLNRATLFRQVVSPDG